MRNKAKLDRPAIKFCGGKKKGSSCGSWAGATVIKTNIKIAA